MEIKATLNKPYSDIQRFDFIVEQNHQLGYEIRETEQALQAWGYTQEEIEEQQKQARNQEIDNKIKELQIMALPDILEKNEKNIKLYNDVILGLEQAKL